VTRHRTVVAATLAGVLFGLPHLWQLPVDQKVMLGSIMGLSFVMAHFILSSIQTSSTAMRARYQMLFEQSPSAVMEEDWSEAIAYVRSEYSGKPSRIRQFLLAYPAVVRRAVGNAKIVNANDAALELLGISNPVRFLGYRDPDVVDDGNIESFVSALVCLYEGGTTWEREIPFRTRSGEVRWLLNRSVDTSTTIPGRSVIVGLADITHMKSRHEAMSEVVRAKDEFIANVSHELRTPLTAVIGLTSELAGGGLPEPEMSEMLQLVASQAAEMSNIVDDLLVAARAEVGTVSLEIQPVDLLTELRATLEGLGMQAGLPSATPPVVLADPRRVRQILRNLLTNAQRYGGPDRRVTSGAHGGSAWLAVCDNGPAIPDEQVVRMFEPYATSGGRESVGLGLAVARQLAELMGGKLAYERRAGESVFRLELPVAEHQGLVLASQNDAV
jgi:signal transduction histidine kinase